MFGAGAMSFGRINLALGIGKAFDQVNVLKIYLIHFYITEMADFLFDFGGFVVVVYLHKFFRYGTADRRRIYGFFKNDCP